MNKKLVVILFGICLLNACDSDSKQSGYDKCSDAGCLCNTDSFRNICDDTTRIACDGGIVTKYNCADDGFICFHGECFVKPDTTCTSDFKDKCIGNNLFYCSDYDNTIDRDQCGGEDGDGVCATVNDITNCYGKCDTEGEFFYACDDYSHDDSALKFTCSKTDKGLLWVPAEEACHACYTVKPGGDIERNGDNNNICVKDKCAQGAEDAACSGNQAVNCINGYELKFDCGDLQCVVEEDMGAICAQTCSPDQGDTTKHVCSLERDSYSGFVSTSYLCEKIGDKYYWIYDDSETCNHGCNDTSGECLKIHPDEDKPCSMDDEDPNYYPDRCENNIILTCEGSQVYARNCGSLTCLNPDDRGYSCYELCTAEEIANPHYTCTIDGPVSPGEAEIIMADSYFSGCKEVEPGKYAKVSSYEYCPHGCNTQTGRCEKKHEDEGKPCEPDMQEYCSDDIRLYCSYGSIKAESCKEEMESEQGTCITLDSSIEFPYDVTRTRCAISCTEADVGHPVKMCRGDYLYSLECMSDGNGHYYLEDEYYFDHPQEYTYCKNGCDETKNECIKLHEDEGKPCNPEADDAARCISDNILLDCHYYGEDPETGEDIYLYESYDCTHMITDFENVSCIEINSNEYKLNPYCRATCTAADVDHPMITCDYDYLEGWECIQWGESGVYFWSRVNEYCAHGCDTSTHTCTKLHEAEGTLCNPEEVYATCFDDYVMFCEEAEFDSEKNQMNYRYVLEEACNPEGETHPVTEGMPDFEKFTCVTYTSLNEDDWGNDKELQYASCMPGCTAQDVDHPQITCEDDHSDSWKCIQSGDTYYWDYDSMDCDNGCDPDGSGCIIYSEYEGTDCNYPAESNKCDDKNILTCEDDHKWHIFTKCDGVSVCAELTPHNFACSSSCTPAQVNTRRDVCDDYEDNVLNNYICLYDVNLDDYRWQNDYVTTCDHGCNRSANECIKIHDDEYMLCSSNETSDSYYQARCESNQYLACNGYNFVEDTQYVSAIDCSLSGPQFTCHPQLGCYIPCDTVSDETKNYCVTREQDGSAYIMTGKCVLDNETQIKHVEYISHYSECLSGCNATHDACQE